MENVSKAVHIYSTRALLVIQFAPSDWVSLRALLPGERCCVCLMTLLKDFGTLPVVLLKDLDDADQYKQWDIPGGSDALMVCLYEG